MRYQSKEIAAVVIALAIGAFPASAQRYPSGTFGKGETKIAVSYSIRVPLKDDSEEAQAEAMQRGRRMLYEMSAKECELILATIATSCRLEDLNVQSSVRRVRSKEEDLSLSANARFAVVMKSATDQAAKEPAEEAAKDEAESAVEPPSEKPDDSSAAP